MAPLPEPNDYTQADASIGQTTQDLVRQLAQLRQQAAQQQLAYTQNLNGAGNLATQGFNADVAGLTNDLKKQGVDTSGFTTQMAAQQQQLAAAQQRQQSYINTLANSYQSGLGQDETAALQQQAAAHAALAANYGLDTIDSSGGGGGGGGYGGYDGYGGSSGNYNDDQLSAGDASLAADLAEMYQYGNTPYQSVKNNPAYDVTQGADDVANLADHGFGSKLLQAYLHGGAGMGHVSGGGAHSAMLAEKYIKRYAAHVNTKTSKGKKNLKEFVKGVRNEQKKVQENASKRHAAIKANRKTVRKAKGRRLID